MNQCILCDSEIPTTDDIYKKYCCPKCKAQFKEFDADGITFSIKKLIERIRKLEIEVKNK